MRQKAAGSKRILQQRHEVLKAENPGGGCQATCQEVGQGGQARSCLCWMYGGGLAVEGKEGSGRLLSPLTLCFSTTDASDLQGRQLLAGLDKVARDLDQQEKAITGILRPPLEQGRAVQDSAERSKDLKVLLGWGTGWAPLLWVLS